MKASSRRGEFEAVFADALPGLLDQRQRLDVRLATPGAEHQQTDRQAAADRDTLNFPARHAFEAAAVL